ncbi:MAG TPA: DEAD/DEAH box helicase [Candidatus Paceibacterota bacterium]|nr:DEAD/DEAH box helicase [Candidatus Paceibacterota bacterium]
MYKNEIRGGSKTASYAPSRARTQFGPRRPFNGSRPPFRGGGGARNKRKTVFIDETLYINKAKECVLEVYTPTHTFADFGLHETIVSNLVARKYVTPSPIQDQAIPVVMQGKDVIGIANTGTGKTAAFLLPLVHKLAENPHQKVMVLAPTRELAQQIEKELLMFKRGFKLWSVTCVGGAPIGSQMRELERGVHFVIGTPGRVKDLINRGKIKMPEFKTIVLDEADRMMDMGFIADMRYILKLMAPERQSLFFSATMSPSVKTLCGEFLREPVTISVKTRDTAQNVDQDVVRVESKEHKIEALHDLLIKPECAKVLIFREMKRHVDDLGRTLRDRGFKALALHGDMRNRQRELAVRSLAKGEVQVLVATDVAARGIDIPDITHVINYDVPQDYETYIHRIGRTGRGSSKGTALTFVHK